MLAHRDDSFDSSFHDHCSCAGVVDVFVFNYGVYDADHYSCQHTPSFCGDLRWRRPRLLCRRHQPVRAAWTLPGGERVALRLRPDVGGRQETEGVMVTGGLGDLLVAYE